MSATLKLATRKFSDGPELKAWRERHGLTQRQAAVQLGLSESHMQTIEGGNSPLTRTLRALMAALDKLASAERDATNASLARADVSRGRP
jgi:transcriptional regulator with XRE-family HTH domain